MESGAIGELRLIRGAFTFTLTHRDDVRLVPSLGGGSLWDVGCYPVSFARHLAGVEPLEVFGWQAVGGGGVDITFAGLLRFPGEVIAQFDCGFRAPFRAHLEVVGSEGTLTVPQPFKPGVNETVFLQRGSERQAIPIPGQELYVGEVEDLADAILLGRTPRVTLADSRGNTAALTFLLRSAREGRPVLMSTRNSVPISQ